MLPSQLCSFLSPALGKCSSAVSDPPLPTLPSLSSYCAPFITAERDSPKMAKHGRLVNVPKPSKRVQKGLKWSTYLFLTIWDPLGPIWALLDHFKPKLIFCSKVYPPNPTLSMVDPKVKNWFIVKSPMCGLIAEPQNSCCVSKGNGICANVVIATF